jgi:hypothetical protein
VVVGVLAQDAATAQRVAVAPGAARQRQPPCTVYRSVDGKAPNAPLRSLDLTPKDLAPKILRQSAHPGSHDDRCTWLPNSGLSSAINM